MRRERALSLLHEAGDVPVVLVVAPAGYGKSTVLGQWLDEGDRPSAWLSVSKTHDDSAALLADVVRLLDECEPFEPETVRGLTATEADFSSVVIPRLERAVASRRAPFVLVLDDVHFLRRQAAWEVVRALARHIPVGSQLAIATRHDPPLPVAQMRAEGRLVTLDPSILTMTATEGAELLHRAGLRLEPEQADHLVERTEGWPVGLYLASLALREQDDPAEAVSLFAGDDHFVADYLRDEFLASLSKRTREFLVRTSILERLSGPICDAILERRGSGTALEDAAQSNLLLLPLDRRGEWYRYHHLFRDMLSSELRRREPELEAALHARASAWFEANGDLDAAIIHAIAGDDRRRVDALIFQTTPFYIAAGRTQTVQRWLDAFTPAQIATRPALIVSMAWCAFTAGDMEAVALWATVASDVDTGPLLPDGTSMGAAAALLRALVAKQGLASMRDDAARYCEFTDGVSPFRGTSRYLEGAALRLLGEPSAARSRLNEAAAIGQVVAPTVQAHALAQLGLLAIDDDDWPEADRLANQALGVIEEFGLAERPAMAGPFAVIALVHARAGAAGEARSELKHGLYLLSMFTGVAPWLAVEARMLLARTAMLLGDLGIARVLLAEAPGILELVPDGDLLALSLRQLEQSIDADTTPIGVGASPMSPAEMRVLRYLPTHLTFAGIADELFVSRNTIKTQAISIYRKLGVSSRHPAVESARALGLLER